VREYQEAATALPRSLNPLPPPDGLKGRVLASVTGRQAPRRAILSRVFWAAAAVALFALLLQSLTDTSVKLQLKGTSAAPEARGTVRWVDRTVTLELSGLPALPAGKEYQLWHLDPNAIPQRTFKVDASGSFAGDDTAKHLIARGHKFALTVEPAGGSNSPTMPIVAITE
jgi:anti-sigma-K factor RskA